MYSPNVSALGPDSTESLFELLEISTKTIMEHCWLHKTGFIKVAEQEKAPTW